MRLHSQVNIPITKLLFVSIIDIDKIASPNAKIDRIGVWRHSLSKSSGSSVFPALSNMLGPKCNIHLRHREKERGIKKNVGTTDVYGHLLRIQPNPDVGGGSGEDSIHHQPRALLL